MWDMVLKHACNLCLLFDLQSFRAPDMTFLVESTEQLASALRIRSAEVLSHESEWSFQKPNFISNSSFSLPSNRKLPESLRVFAESLNNPVSYSSSWKGQQDSPARHRCV